MKFINVLCSMRRDIEKVSVRGGGNWVWGCCKPCLSMSNDDVNIRYLFYTIYNVIYWKAMNYGRKKKRNDNNVHWLAIKSRGYCIKYQKKEIK